MMGRLSTSFKEWYTKYGIKDAEKIVTMIPINMRPLSNIYSELNMDNCIVAIKFELPIRSDIQSAMTQNKSTLSTLTNLTYLMCAFYLGKMMPYFSENMNRGIMTDYCKGADLMFSNVPFSTEPWYFCNKEIKRFRVFVNVQQCIGTNIVAVTYKNNLRLTVTTKNQLKMDPAELLDIMVQQIEDDIAKSKQE